MKFLIGNYIEFGCKNLRIDNIVSLGIGSFGDFEKPYYHKVLYAEYIDCNGMHGYNIIGKYSNSFKRRKYLFFGKVTSITLFGFKSEFKKEDIYKILEMY